MLGFLRRPEKKKTEEGVKRTRDAWWGKVVRLFDSSALGDDLWDELEELLISADVGVGTATKLVTRVRERVDKERIKEVGQARTALKEEMIALLTVGYETPADAQNGQLAVILVVGVNGVGKTTSIAKLAHGLKQEGKRVIIAAGDTFRAAAIDQIKIWGERIDVPVVAHQPGGDPAAVVFDALETARKNADCVIVDTAGRMQTKFNLMEELKKIKALARKHDFSLVVVSFPVAYQVYAEFVADAPQRELWKICEKYDLPCLDLLPLFRSHNKENLFFDHCHPKELGNDLIGRAVAEFIQREVIQAQGSGG